MKDGLRRSFAYNISYAFTAQFFSLIVSVLMSLIVPRILGVEQFAYWQLFIFYSGYVGLFHFGISDGVYLRYGGTPLEQIDESSIGSQMLLMTSIHTVIAIIVVAAVVLFDASERGFVWICTAVYLVLANLFWYLGYVFQAANETKVYSFTIILIKAAFILFLIVLIIFRQKRFTAFIAAFLVSQLIGTSYILWKGKRFVFAPRLPLRVTLRNACENARVGINLTFSNIASSLILGVGRMMVDAGEGIAAFGMVSMALSLTNFFLQFITQVSLVMFPMLRQFDKERQKKLYLQLRELLGIVLCGLLILYVPIKYLLGLWLPQYEESLAYLGILLPICIFDGKMQLLYNTYLKVAHKERVLLAINLGVLALSAALSAISVFVLHSVKAVVVTQVLVICVRSLIASRYLSGYMGIEQEKNVLWEMLLTAVFIIGNEMLPPMWAFGSYTVCYALYWLTHAHKISGGLLSR